MTPRSQANRSTFATHFDDTLIAEQAEEQARRLEERKSELAELKAIANLADHPGWQELMASWKVKIDNFRSGKFLAEILLTDASDAKIGQLTRVGNLVADEMEALIATVAVANEAVEEERGRERSKRATEGGN